MTVIRNQCYDPSWIGVGGTLLNEQGTIARSLEQVRHVGGGALKVIHEDALGTDNNAFDTDDSRWAEVAAGDAFSFSAWVYPVSVERPYEAGVHVYRASDKSFQETVSSGAITCDTGEWTFVWVSGIADHAFTCKLNPFVWTGSHAANVQPLETFYTTDWCVRVGDDTQGYGLPAPGPITDGAYNFLHTLVKFGSDPQGELMMIYRKATSHYSPGDYGTVVGRRSLNQGQSWLPPFGTDPVTIKAEANIDLRPSCAGGLSPSGRLFAVYTRVNPDTDTRLSMNYLYSDDEGDSWSAEQTIAQGALTNAMAHGWMIEIADGKLLQGFYDDTTHTSYVVLSDDDGVTWSAGITVVAPTAGEQYSEGSYVHLGGGVIVGLIRDDVGTTFTQVKSVDNGLTWATQGTTSFDSWLNASPPALTTAGTLIACHYGNRSDLVLRVTYADPAELVNGPDAWDAPTVIDAAITVNDSGYPSPIHPFEDQRAFGICYDGPRTVPFDSPTAPLVEGPAGSEYFDGRGYFQDGVWNTDSGGENVRWSGTPDGSPSDYYVNGSGVSSPAERAFVHAAGRGQ